MSSRWLFWIIASLGMTACGGSPAPVEVETEAVEAELPPEGCTTLSTFPTTLQFAYYSVQTDNTVGVLYQEAPQSASGERHDKISLFVHHSGGSASFPSRMPYTPAYRELGCNTTCLSMWKNCNSAGECASGLIPQAGELSVSQATREPNAGKVVATAAKVRFREWDFTVDRPVARGACIDVQAIDLDIEWDAPRP